MTTKCLKFVIAKYITYFPNYIINFKIIIIKKVEANYVCKFNFRYYEMKKGKQIIIKIFLSFLVFVGKI